MPTSTPLAPNEPHSVAGTVGTIIVVLLVLGSAAFMIYQTLEVRREAQRAADQTEQATKNMHDQLERIEQQFKDQADEKRDEAMKLKADLQMQNGTSTQ